MSNVKKEEKKNQMNLFTKQKQTHICEKQTCYQWGKQGEGAGEVEKLGYIKIYVYLNIFINIKYKYINTYKYPYK